MEATDGGDGGDGGKVKLVVDGNTDNLRNFHYDPKLYAEDGAPWAKLEAAWTRREKLR